MLLSINNLTFQIGKVSILKDINLKLDGSQVVTLLGPNGAGKSTLLKVCAGALFGKKGKVEFDNIDAETNRLNYLKLIGYMPENAVVIPALSVVEQLNLYASTRCIKNSQQHIQRVMQMCQLEDVANKRTHKLSLGYKQRLNLAQALLNSPKVLIMDEPLNGLDPHLIIEFRNIIKQLKKVTLVIMSTHYLAEAQMISDRVLIMKEGKLLDNIEMIAEINLEELYMQHTL